MRGNQKDDILSAVQKKYFTCLTFRCTFTKQSLRDWVGKLTLSRLESSQWAGLWCFSSNWTKVARGAETIHSIIWVSPRGTAIGSGLTEESGVTVTLNTTDTVYTRSFLLWYYAPIPYRLANILFGTVMDHLPSL